MRIVLLFVSTVALAGGVRVTGTSTAPPSAAPSEETCTALQRLTSLPVKPTVISTAVLNAKSDAVPAPNAFTPPTPPLPAHCEVVGKINERDGANGQKYAISFRLRLPTDWNGRFFFQGGGGSNGNIGNALGALQGMQPNVALGMGYAVVSQDSGHDNMANNDPARGGTSTFGFDQQARVDFGYRSYDVVTRVSKAIVKQYYGRLPERSYYVGCSEGGREGMVVSQRFPAHFDGVLACAPGFRLARAAVAEAWDSQAFAAVAKEAGLADTNNQPFLNKTFTDVDLALVSNAVLSACDDIDGAVDGLVQSFLNCTTSLVRPSLAALTCEGAKSDRCLSAAQIKALEKVFEGARTSTGTPLYANWAWDAGIGGKTGAVYNQGWRVWKIGPYGANANSAINLTLGATALPSIFQTPPVAVATAGGGAAAFSLGFDLDSAPRGLSATSGAYRASVLDFMKADSTDLGEFRRRGGKLVIAHGVSDPIFSILDTVDWWNAVNKANRGSAADFVRLFAVPGMNHCAGGPSTDQFDAFGALVEWVERGAAPARIIATARATTPWPGRTRPLCPYPQVATYMGSGSLESAESFVCK